MTSGLVFFLYLRGAASFAARARFFLLAISLLVGARGELSERFFVVLRRRGGAVHAARGRVGGVGGAVAGPAGTDDLLHLGLGPAQARPDLVGDHFDLRALLALLG